MKGARRRTGRAAEDLAAAHLAALGLAVVERNRRVGRWGEIDIVARDGETTVVVEVRAVRSPRAPAAPLETIGPAKRRRLVRLAKAYAAARGISDAPLRIDCVGVRLGADGRPMIEHVPNAVEDEV